MKEIIKTQQLKTGCIIIKPRITLNVFEFKKNTVKSIYPAFINFEGNGFLKKQLYLYQIRFLFTIGKPVKSYLEKIFQLFYQSLFLWKKIKKTLFLNY
jgi:hypothetical protein